MTAANEALATDPAVTCAHCGLPVPARAPAGPPASPGAAGPAFCCGGCRAAWTLIHASGLDRFYALGERARPVALDAAALAWAEFDHPSFHERHVRALAGGLREVELYLEGVHCASCVWLVERLPLVVPGAVRAELDLPRARVRVEFDPARPLSEIARALATLGYRPHPYRAAAREARRRAEDRAMLARIGVAGALAGNVMMLAAALYAGWFGRHGARVRALLPLAQPAAHGARAALARARVLHLGAWARSRRARCTWTCRSRSRSARASRAAP